MNRPAFSTLLLAVTAGLLLLLALAFIGLRLARPFANDRLAPETNSITAAGLVVTPLNNGPAGLLAGDVVTAVEGRPLTAWPAGRADRWQFGQPVRFSVLRQGQPAEITVLPARYPLGAILLREWGTFTFYLLYLMIASFVFLRQPQVTAARVLFLAAAAQFGAIAWSIGLQAGDFNHPELLWLFHLSTIGGFMLTWIADFHFALVFPRPAPLLERRWVLPVLYTLPYGGLIVYFAVSRPGSVNGLEWMGRWGSYTGWHAAVFLLLTFATIVWQYRRSRGTTRQQIRWLVLGGVLVAGSALLFYFLPPLLGGRALTSNLIGLIGTIFPLSVAVAVLRHNLFDIDTLLNRALVYSGLTFAVIALYVLVVGILGAILQIRSELAVSLIGTGLVAVVFQPLRSRLQKAVNRLLYGERDEPFDVLAQLGQRLEGTLSPTMVFPTIVETVAQTLKLPFAAVTVNHNGQQVMAHSIGQPVEEAVIFPLTYQGEAVGQLLVARRSPDEPFSAADDRLLRNIARQAGVAVHTVRLMDELQHSRQRLVSALEEERRRLRRDLHDGLGPQLASQTLTIDAIEKMLARDPDRARALLADLKNQSRAAVHDIRRLVYGLRPPALDELGLIGALRESVARQSHNGLQINLKSAQPLPPLPAAVEVAAYYVAQEALNNAVRHAQASTCFILLRVDHRPDRTALCLTVEDDGRGLPAVYEAGVGLQSMRERAAELGGTLTVDSAAAGGVRVQAFLPFPAESIQEQQPVKKKGDT